jgi:hypothetical protein
MAPFSLATKWEPGCSINMHSRLLLCLVFALSGGLMGCLMTGRHASANLPASRQYFHDYLNQCATNEIRCLWFLQDDPRIGMEMTVRLQARAVQTIRDHYDWAREESPWRNLDYLDISQLDKIVHHLPPPAETSPYASTVFVAVPTDGTNRIYQYDRHYPPGEVRKLYQFTGGYFYGDEAD